jgi:glycosyltransferase involved in cell wall biosynthesis
MAPETQPLVSVVTPVYNGGKYLAECIESVLAQTYQNWDYVIANNCSTDRTLEIAQAYAAKDSRIHIYNNDKFLPIIANHNSAIRQISSESKYCKMVCADDLLLPECIERMVRVAEAFPSIGIVGAYGLEGARVLWEGLPYPSTFIPGREICRKSLLGGPYVFGTPHSLLYRSDLIRTRRSFYQEANPHADNEVCYEVLQSADFGFIHQILTLSVDRSDSNSAAARKLESYVLCSLSAVITHGPIYLSPEEYKVRLEQWMRQYYRALAKSWLRLRGKEFWSYHRERLMQLGHPLSPTRLAKAVVREIFRGVLHPLDALDGVLTWWPKALSGIERKRAR